MLCRCSPLLEEVTLLVSSSEGTDDSLAALVSLRSLRVLELCSRPALLTRGQLRLAGMLDLRELRLESHAFRLQPLTRLDHSHVDNEGVKALVDSVCTRCMFQSGPLLPLHLCSISTCTTHMPASLGIQVWVCLDALLLVMGCPGPKLPWLMPSLCGACQLAGMKRCSIHLSRGSACDDNSTCEVPLSLVFDIDGVHCRLAAFQAVALWRGGPDT